MYNNVYILNVHNTHFKMKMVSGRLSFIFKIVLVRIIGLVILCIYVRVKSLNYILYNTSYYIKQISIKIRVYYIHVYIDTVS